MSPLVKVIIPAFNEADSIAHVVNDIPRLVSEVVVVDNNSQDATARNARAAGATVLFEPKKGYGHACLKGISYVSTRAEKPEIIVFLDGDYSDFPEELPGLLEPILERNADLVIGARVKKWREPGAMTFPQIFGNWLATFLMKLFFNAEFTDLGPFRAIKYDSLMQLQMEDKTYGWTVEMQLKAIKRNYRYEEVPVHYRNRIGTSKVSGTVKGAFMAGVKILTWIFKYSLK